MESAVQTVKMNRGLFLDIGYANTGAVVIDITPSGYGGIVSAECFTTKPVKSKTMRYAVSAVRGCKELYVWLKTFFGISVVGVELPHGGGKSAKAVRAMAYATAVVACLEATWKDIPFVYVSPEDAKFALCGSKRASKEDMVEAARVRYSTYGGFPEAKNKMEHIADAIGVSEAIKDDQILRMLRNG